MPFDLILMDMQMPVMDGLAATREIRQLPQHARTPILAMTANAFGDDRQACLDAGMNDHLAKPVDPELLYAMLKRWLPAPQAVAPLGGLSTGQPSHQTPKQVWTPPRASGLSTTSGQTAAAGAQASGATQTSPASADRFANIPGLTMSRALLYLPGRDGVFARVLRQFVDSYSAGLPALTGALTADRRADARRTLHALRGACGAVGATRVMDLAQQLETALVDDEAPHDGILAAAWAADAAALEAELASLVAQVSERLARPDAAASPAATLDLAALPAAVASLAALLEVSDFRANERHRDLEPLLLAAYGDEAAQAIERPLRMHDYDGALHALQRAVASGPRPQAAGAGVAAPGQADAAVVLGNQ